MNQELATKAVCLETTKQKLEGKAKGGDAGRQTCESGSVVQGTDVLLINLLEFLYSFDHMPISF